MYLGANAAAAVDATAVGVSARAAGRNSVALGLSANAGAVEGIALGAYAFADSEAVAVGVGASASAGSIVLSAGGALAASSFTGGFYVAPVRGTHENETDSNRPVYFNTDRNEFVYNVLCFAEGTRIRLADGTAIPIELVTYGHELLSWDLHTGKAVSGVPLWIKAPEVVDEIVEVRLALAGAPETEVCLQTVGAHRVLCARTRAFTPVVELVPGDVIATAATTVTAATTAKTARVTAVVRSRTRTRSYNILVKDSVVLVAAAGNILTSCRLSNLAPIDVATRAYEAPPAAIHTHLVPALFTDPELHPYEKHLPLAAALHSVFGGDKDALREYVARLHTRRARAHRPILFLDHQGVMRTAPNPRPGQLAAFDPACVAALNTIYRAVPDVSIIVSSDWQAWVTFAGMRQFYFSHADLLVAPDGFTLYPASSAKSRAICIVNYMSAYTSATEGAVPAWVAVDDLNMAEFLPSGHFVHCADPAVGLAAPGVVDALIAALRHNP